MKKEDGFDFHHLKQEVMEGLFGGKSTLGLGVLADLPVHILNNIGGVNDPADFQWEIVECDQFTYS